MACNLTSGVTLDCRENVGGVKSVWIASADSGMEGLATGGTASSITLTSGGTPITTNSAFEAAFYEFEQPKQAASLTETGNFSEENGTAFYQSVATLFINKLDANYLNILDTLGANTKLAVAVEDNNGQKFLVGNFTGAIVTSSTSQTGTAFGDRSGISLELTGFSKDPMYSLGLS